MSDFADDVIAYPIASLIASAIPAELAKRYLPGVCTSGVVPGAVVAYDFCDEDGDGVAWVRLVTMFPSTVFPQQDFTISKLPVVLAQQYEVGLIRRSPVPDNGQPADEDELHESARLTFADASALAAVICAQMEDIDRGFMLDRWTPVGPDGGAVGGFWTVTVKPRGA